jgi:hypothetical protein
VLLGNGLWLLTNGWYVHAEYARPGFPDDRYGFTGEQRTAIALAAIVGAGLVLWRLGFGRLIPRALLGGGLLTLGIAAGIGIYMLVNFDGFFVQFHEALFEGDTWRFRSTDTLLRLYPDAFWSDFGGVLAALTVLQALGLSGVCWWRLRRSRAALTAPIRDGEPASSH